MHKILRDKKHIFIDMGNTLLDFHQGLTDDEKDLEGLTAMSAFLKSKNIMISNRELKLKFLDTLYDKFYLRKEQLVEIDVYEILRSFLSVSDNVLEGALKAFYSIYAKMVIIHPYARELLEALKKEQKTIGIISNCYLPSFIYKQIFIDQGLDDYIDTYTFSYDYMIRKPNPDLFHHAIKYPVDECLMIGDGYIPDILGAAEIGVDSIWYNHKELPIREHKHMKLTIASLQELL